MPRSLFPAKPGLLSALAMPALGPGAAPLAGPRPGFDPSLWNDLQQSGAEIPPADALTPLMPSPRGEARESLDTTVEPTRETEADTGAETGADTGAETGAETGAGPRPGFDPGIVEIDPVEGPSALPDAPLDQPPPREVSSLAQAQTRMPFVEAPAEIADTMFEWTMPSGFLGLGPLRGRLLPREPEPAPVVEPAPAPLPSPGSVASDFTGAGQVVVVIDDGYSPFYDQSATVAEYDYAGFFNDPDASVATLQSHGSWVAQTVTDTATGADIVHLKVFPDTGGGASLFDIEEALDAVINAAEQVQIAAVNLSLGFGNATTETMTQLSDEFAELDDLGIFSIVAAGNAGETYEDGVNVLAADPNVIGVSAVDDTGAFADFSQTSEELTDIAALGVDVGVETITGAEGTVSGTSFAAPTIAGIAAILQEAALATIGETLTDEEFLEILQASGSDVTGEGEGEDLPDGYAVADADAAVDYFLENASEYGELLLV